MKAYPIDKCCSCSDCVPPQTDYRGKPLGPCRCNRYGHDIEKSGVIDPNCKLPEYPNGN